MPEINPSAENVKFHPDNTVTFELRRTRLINGENKEIVFRYQVEMTPFAYGGMGKLYNGWLISSPENQSNPAAPAANQSEIGVKQVALAFKEPILFDLSGETDSDVLAEKKYYNQKVVEMLAAEFMYMQAVARRNFEMVVIGLDYMIETVQNFLEDNVIIMEKIEAEDEFVLNEVLHANPGGIGVDGTLLVLDDTSKVLDTEADEGHLLIDNAKPENIFVCVSPAGVRLADFGLRVNKDKALTQSMGSPSYMTPEQLNKETLVAETLVYQLAILAYELLTGTHFNDGVDEGQAMAFVRKLNEVINVKMQFLKDHLSALAQTMPGAPTFTDTQLNNVETVLRFALSRNPKQRYHRCAHFVKALEDALTKENQLWFPDDFVNPDELVEPS